MAGRILIYDGIAANRIILRCKLSAACYEVLQAADYDDVLDVARSSVPDLFILDLDENPHRALSVCRELLGLTRGCPAPVLLLATEPSPELRIAAAREGAWSILQKPLHDGLLMASIRRAIRESGILRESRDQSARIAELGLMEDLEDYDSPGRVALIGRSHPITSSWRASLGKATKHKLMLTEPDAALAPASPLAAPDLYVINSHLKRPQDGLRLLSELRSRAASCDARMIVVIDAVSPPADQHLSEAAMALDLGADDVMPFGFHAAELRHKMDIQISQKRQRDHLRNSLKSGVRLAAIDPLTGLYNRRYAVPRLHRMAAQARHAKRPMSVMVLDLDRFKQVNDTYGHAAGDVVLEQVANRLSQVLRPQDLIARSGGEEFLIGLPDTDRETAFQIAQTLREQVRSSPIPLPHQAGLVRITMSIGVADVTNTGSSMPETMDHLLERADSALYRAKENGRDTVLFAKAAA